MQLVRIAPDRPHELVERRGEGVLPSDAERDPAIQDEASSLAVAVGEVDDQVELAPTVIVGDRRVDRDLFESIQIGDGHRRVGHMLEPVTVAHEQLRPIGAEHVALHPDPVHRLVATTPGPGLDRQGDEHHHRHPGEPAGDTEHRPSKEDEQQRDDERREPDLAAQPTASDGVGKMTPDEIKIAHRASGTVVTGWTVVTGPAVITDVITGAGMAVCIVVRMVVYMAVCMVCGEGLIGE